ncbi:helix-turn-helix domain-containing protein [Herbaspirillum sp. RTI4]|uniref:helix-turn-helix domain-containing protein n=1 Tax=Herbaspirillum sp. RTI4 TaxID=3048640 RepID=UPI003A101938
MSTKVGTHSEMMALADSANDYDECWPGIPFVAGKCSVSGRTVQRSIQKFEAAGLISVSPRYTSAGRQTSNGYRLCIAAKVSPDKLSSVDEAGKVEGDNLSGTGVTSRVTVVDDKTTSPLKPSQESEQQPLHCSGLIYPDTSIGAKYTI